MILKILLVIAVIAVVYFMFIKNKPIKNNSSKTDKKKNEKLESNDMVECSSCGVYVGLDESIISNNKYYCSDECVEKG